MFRSLITLIEDSRTFATSALPNAPRIGAPDPVVDPLVVDKVPSTVQSPSRPGRDRKGLRGKTVRPAWS